MIHFKEDEKQYFQTHLPFWSRLTPAEQELVRQNMGYSILTTGTQLVRNSSECNGLILLRTGQIRAFITSEDGREITLYRLFPDDMCIMSASCVLKNLRFTVYLEVEKEGSMFVIPTRIYKKIDDENLAVKEFSMLLMSERFSEVMWIVDQMIFSSIPTRLSKFLLEQSLLSDTSHLQFTHEGIAKNIGTAREVVSRMLKYFEREGLVRLSRGSVLILNKDGLRKLTLER